MGKSFLNTNLFPSLIHIKPTAFSLHRFPIFSILATVIGLAGICLFLITFYSGSDLSIKLLRDIFGYNDNDVEFMEYYQIGFSLIAAFTTVVILLVLLLDYLVTTSMYTGKPMYEFLAGSTPPFVVIIQIILKIKQNDEPFR